jgi:hypothetical protein
MSAFESPIITSASTDMSGVPDSPVSPVSENAITGEREVDISQEVDHSSEETTRKVHKKKASNDLRDDFRQAESVSTQ